MARGTPRSGRSIRLTLATLIGCLVVFGLALQQRWGGASATTVVDDVGELAFAWATAAITFVTCRRSAGRRRRSWAAVTIALAAWGAGELVWSYNDLVADRASLFPSWADAGYLVFPVAAMVALWCYPGAGSGTHARTRLVLDGAIAAASLLVLSWVTTLGAVLHAGGDSAFAFAVSLSYPLSDLALLTVAILVLARSAARRRLPLALMSLGMVAMAVSDSAFTYLQAKGSYKNPLTDLGWPVAFVLMAMAALADRGAAEHQDVEAMPSRLRIFLPYAALPVAGIVVGRQLITGEPISPMEQVNVVVLVTLIFMRQIVFLAENSRLVAEVRIREEQLQYQAFHDPLTGLANRALFGDRLAHAVDLHRRDARPVSVVLIDLDDFKLVNDTLGHPAGDELLVKVGERLLACSRAADTVARFGGDEFALLLEAGSEAPEMVPARLMAAFSQPFRLHAGTVRITASLGLAADSPDTRELSAVEILRDADIAMYAAKRLGKGRSAIFNPDMRGLEADDLALRADLGTAIEQGQIYVAYQPIRDLQTHQLWGVEALARWRTDRVGEVTADRFIPLAERAGLVSAIDDSVLDQAVGQYGEWLRAGLDTPLMLSVNVSAGRLADPGYSADVATVLGRDGVPAERLIIEITESSLMTDLGAAVAIARSLQALGVSVAIDDFGTGHSSLAVLDALPVALLKIDQSFARKTAQETGTALLTGIVEMSRAMGVIPIAEGIETLDEQEVLRSVGCRLGQGYLLGRPTTAAAIAVLLVDPTVGSQPRAVTI
ncbi:MAG: EAL domain-containing protein [Pseudonocardiales bacterium]